MILLSEAGLAGGHRSRRRFPRCLPDYELAEEDLQKDGTRVGYMFAVTQEAPLLLSLLLQWP